MTRKLVLRFASIGVLTVHAHDSLTAKASVSRTGIVTLRRDIQNAEPYTQSLIGLKNVPATMRSRPVNKEGTIGGDFTSTQRTTQQKRSL